MAAAGMPVDFVEIDQSTFSAQPQKPPQKATPVMEIT
jgi:hypothetical protein